MRAGTEMRTQYLLAHVRLTQFLNVVNVVSNTISAHSFVNFILRMTGITLTATPIILDIF